MLGAGRRLEAQVERHDRKAGGAGAGYGEGMAASRQGPQLALAQDVAALPPARGASGGSPPRRHLVASTATSPARPLTNTTAVPRS